MKKMLGILLLSLLQITLVVSSVLNILPTSIRTTTISDALNTGIRQECLLPVPQLATVRNYPVERHHVTTEDGYILELHRIPHGKNNVSTKGPGLLVHGFEVSSFCWALQEGAIAYVLADDGFDVWLANCIGTLYSQRHVNLTIESPRYWNFSWHEMGTYDLPAMIDYILIKTGQQKLHYIGHSQGTTANLVMLSKRNDYNQKLKSAVLLAPVANLKHSSSFLIKFGTIPAVATTLQRSSVAGETVLLPNTGIVQQTVSLLACGTQPTQQVCINLLAELFGNNPSNFNRSLTAPIYCNFPSGSSTKQFKHYIQVAKTGIFGEYVTQQPYNLSKITTKMFLFYSNGDGLVSPLDVIDLKNQLSNVETKLMSDQNFTHIDFLLGLNAKEMVFDPVVTILNQNN